MDLILQKRNEFSSFANKYKIDSFLFFISFIIYLIGHFISGTMFIYVLDESFPYQLWMIACILAITKILLFNHFENWQGWVFSILIGLFIWCCSLNTNTWDMIYYYVMIIAAKDIKFENIIKIFLVVVVSCLAITFISAKLGIIDGITNMRDGSSELRYALGTVYPTDLAARIFYIELFYVTLKKFKLTIPEYLIWITLAMFSYIVTDTKLDFILMLLILLAAFFLPYVIRVLEKIGNVGVSSILGILIAGMTVGTYLYNPHNSILLKINNALSGRLQFSHIAFKKFNVTLFGQVIEQTGNGGLHHGIYAYFYIDSSYIRILMMNGLFCFILVIGTMLWLSNKFLNEKMFALELALIFMALSSIIDQHLLEISFECIFLALLANNQAFKNR